MMIRSGKSESVMDPELKLLVLSPRCSNEQRHEKTCLQPGPEKIAIGLKFRM